MNRDEKKFTREQWANNEAFPDTLDNAHLSQSGNVDWNWGYYWGVRDALAALNEELDK